MAANEEVVAELISKLTTDVSEFMKGMKQSVDATKKTAEDVEKHSKQIEGFGNKLGSYAKTAMGALASLGAGDFLKDSLHKFQEAEGGVLKLTAALESNGRQVEETLKDYNEFAAGIQEVTVLDDDAVLSLLRMAESFDLTGEAAKNAVRNSIALAAVNDDNAQSMIRLTAAMEKGDIERAMAFARMIPQLSRFKDQAEFIKEYNRVVTSGFKASAAEAASSAGKIKALTGAYDNLKEEVGAVVAEAINPLVGMLKETVKWFTELDPNIKRFIFLLGMATAAAVIFWTAMNAGAILFNMLTGGVLLLIGVILAGAVAIAAWASQFEDMGQAVNVAKGYIQKLIDNWELLFPVIALTVRMVKELWPLLTELWDEVSREGTQAWEEIKAGINEFMVAAKPILDELKRLGPEAWNLIKQAATGALRVQIDGLKVLIGWLREYYTWLGQVNQRLGEMEIAGLKGFEWIKRIGETIKFSITLLRLMVNSWEDTFTLLGVIVHLKMTEIFEDIKHVFTVSGPIVLKYFAEQVKNAFNQIARYVATVFVNLIDKLAQSIEELPQILKDRNRLAEIWKGVFPEGGLAIKIDPFPDKIPDRVITQLERDLLEAVNRLQARIQLRLLGLMFQPEPEVKSWWDRLLDGMQNQAKAVGDNLGDGIKAATKEVERFDAALTRSAESVTRLEQYRDRISGFGMKAAPAMPAPADVMMFENRQQPIPVQLHAADNQNNQEQVGLLRDIRNIARDEAAKPIMRVEFVNLEG